MPLNVDLPHCMAKSPFRQKLEHKYSKQTEGIRSLFIGECVIMSINGGHSNTFKKKKNNSDAILQATETMET